MMGMTNGPAALTVSELNEYARKLLAGDPLLRSLEVTGEISGYKHHYSGHRYFSLKDENARVQCVMFRQNAMSLDFKPEDGMRVTVRASASIFPRDGSFQLYVNSMLRAGQGDLFIRFERLKQKLLAEGLFDPARKKEIPAFPSVIGVATSQTGAAVRDIIHVARRRNPNIGIVVSPCAVQGEGAAEDIVRAIRRLNERDVCDVILVGRGGGSIEDLWAFNEEVVARAIAASRIPVISCVGHEIDFTISDFAADLRAPTPSAAAELAVPELAGMREAVNGMLRRFSSAMNSAQQQRRLRLQAMIASPLLTAPGRALIEPRRAELKALTDRALRAMPARIERQRHKLIALEASLRALNPAAVLDRGYAVVLQEGRVTGSVLAVDPKKPIRIRLSDGKMTAKVNQITPKDGQP